METSDWNWAPLSSDVIVSVVGVVTGSYMSV